VAQVFNLRRADCKSAAQPVTNLRYNLAAGRPPGENSGRMEGANEGIMSMKRTNRWMHLGALLACIAHREMQAISKTAPIPNTYEKERERNHPFESTVFWPTNWEYHGFEQASREGAVLPQPAFPERRSAMDASGPMLPDWEYQNPGEKSGLAQDEAMRGSITFRHSCWRQWRGNDETSSRGWERVGPC
jgi:hypothetical protein